MRANRLQNRKAEVERLGRELVALDPNYAPTYLELGMHYDREQDYARATLAYDAYLLLAPNFADSGQVRQRAGVTRSSAGRKSVTLFDK
jgi:tetratricopeptide (TPR) repeat protein